MRYFFLFYIFLLPLEYIHQDKIPKGPTGVNYQNITLLLLLIWLLVGQRRATPGGGVAATAGSFLSPALAALLTLNFLGRILGSVNYDTIASPFVVTEYSFSNFMQFFNGILLFWVVLKVFNTRRHLHWLMGAILLSAPLVIRSLRSDLGGANTAHYSHDLRFQGPFTNIGSNELGAFMVVGALFFLIYGLRASRLWWPRAALLGGAALYIYGVIYSYSRASQLSLIIGLGLLAMLRYRAALLVMLVLYVSMPLWVPTSVRERWEMTEDEQGELDESAQSRKDFWAMAIDMWETSPLIGHGVGAFRASTGMDTHGMYHRVLAEQGVIGFAVFLWVWLALIAMSAQLWLRAPTGPDGQLGLALLVITVALMVANIFGDRFTHLVMIGQFWALAGVAARLRAHVLGQAPLDDEIPSTAQAAAEPAGPAHPGWWQPAQPLALVGAKAGDPRLGLMSEMPAPDLKLMNSPTPPPAPPAHPDLNVIGPRPAKLTIVNRRKP